VRSFNGLQKAMRRNSAWMARLGAVLTSLMWQQAPIAQISAPDRGGPPMMEERQIVKLFDRDGDRLLNRIEREAARDWLANQPRSGRFGRPNPVTGAMPPPWFGGRGFAPASPGTQLAPADVPAGGAAGLYDPTTLRTIFLQFENAEWERELADFNNTDVEVPASLMLDGVTYRDVGVHFRGMSSFMMVPDGSKRSLNLSIDYVHETQRLLGYRTLNLLNANGDPTFLRPVLYTEIAKRYVPTPSANYIRVVINGEYWGVYVNTQQFNADFTREWFASTKGARWKVPGSPMGRGGMEYLGENVDAYRTHYEIKSKDDPAAWRSLVRMFRVLNETPPEKLAAALAPMLDVDGALKFLAVEMALANSDGYWARASDYNLYMDERGRFHVIPHDVNEGLAEETFGRGGPPAGARRGMPPGAGPVMFGRGMVHADVMLDPLVGLDDARKPLRSKLLAVPALRARYLSHVRQIAERWLDWERLEPVARRHHARIAEAVRADTKKLYTSQAFESGVSEGSESLKSFVIRRRAFLLQEK
jgi:hypothetical protein